MKRILITGENSYIGNSFEVWAKRYYGDHYKVDKVSLRTEKWKSIDFSIYNVVLHIAGVAHIKEKKIDKELFMKVNRDLAYEVAVKSKNDGVQHFIFFSTMSVYGITTGIIDNNTVLSPNTYYGISKLEAEEKISTLLSSNFKIANIRPPIIYGKGCEGNYPKLSKLIQKFPIFPNVNNRRSMLFIENLNRFLKVVIDNGISRTLYPQNKEYVNITELAKMIRVAHGKKTYLTKVFNPIIYTVDHNIVDKVFGDLYYDINDPINKSIQQVDFEKSVFLTEE